VGSAVVKRPGHRLRNNVRSFPENVSEKILFHNKYTNGGLRGKTIIVNIPKMFSIAFIMFQNFFHIFFAKVGILKPVSYH